MKNPYAITERTDGWWIVLNEKCGTHIISRNAQTKVDAMKGCIDLYRDLLFQCLDQSPDYAEEVLDSGLVDVIEQDELQ